MIERIFVVEWTFISWKDISFGFHFYLGGLYFDMHLPFGWLRIGWEIEPCVTPINLAQCLKKRRGLNRYRRLIKQEENKDAKG